jgi:hypothetical protein
VNIGDLQRYLTEPSSPEEAHPTVIVAPDAPVQPVVEWLTRRFAEADGLATITVRIGDDDPGVLARDSVLELQTPISKGALGEGDFTQLPGLSPLTSLRLRCPIDGAQFTRYFYDEASPPTCPVHLGTVLELE